jgi:replicative DNA helicase
LGKKTLELEDFSSLPFDESLQQAILGHLLVNPILYKQVEPFMEPAWFLNLRHQQIFKHFRDYVKICPSFPNLESFKAYLNVKVGVESVGDYNVLLSQIDLAIARQKIVSDTAFKDGLLGWLKARIYYEGMFKSQQSYNKRNFEEAFKIVNQTSVDLMQASVEVDRVEIPTIDELLAKSEQEKESALTFGLRMSLL